VPVRMAIHAVVDNYATHKHPKVQKWLARHPRWTFHFTPTSALHDSWRTIMTNTPSHPAAPAIVLFGLDGQGRPLAATLRPTRPPLP
jgi:hypothetical protein